MSKEKRKLRERVIEKGQVEINRWLKEGVYVDLLKEKNGIMDDKEVMLDKEFLDDMLKEIKRSKERGVVYNKKYKNHWLDEFLSKNNRKPLRLKCSK